MIALGHVGSLWHNVFACLAKTSLSFFILNKDYINGIKTCSALFSASPEQ